MITLLWPIALACTSMRQYLLEYVDRNMTHELHISMRPEACAVRVLVCVWQNIPKKSLINLFSGIKLGFTIITCLLVKHSPLFLINSQLSIIVITESWSMLLVRLLVFMWSKGN